ncbi:MAG: iron-containing alcohol dehydrogenase, partial [Kiloniellales bacterium]|nr:iron-containing alcohol dehydrogenase [Kiloniellales bacterium]
MACCHYFQLSEGGEEAFSVDASAITFGTGSLSELGDTASALGLKRVALFTDRGVAATEHLKTAIRSLLQAQIDYALYDEVRVEPTDLSFQAAIEFAMEGRFDGYISLGGGSVIDTCKAANLYTTHPSEFLDYVNAPVGGGKAVPGPLAPHIACPTTCGTGSECTGIAIFDLLS